MRPACGHEMKKARCQSPDWQRAVLLAVRRQPSAFVRTPQSAIRNPKLAPALSRQPSFELRNPQSEIGVSRRRCCFAHRFLPLPVSSSHAFETSVESRSLLVPIARPPLQPWNRPAVLSANPGEGPVGGGRATEVRIGARTADCAPRSASTAAAARRSAGKAIPGRRSASIRAPGERCRQ